MTTGGSGLDELDGFTIGARRAFSLAEREARTLGHERVGTEHLLLGLIGEEDGDAAAVLIDAGVAATTVRRKVQEAVGAASRGRPRPRVSRR